MWLLIDTKIVTKLDYNGVEYQTSVLDDKRRDYGEMWRKFAASFDAQAKMEHGHYNGKGYMEYEQRKLMEDNI